MTGIENLQIGNIVIIKENLHNELTEYIILVTGIGGLILLSPYISGYIWHEGEDGECEHDEYIPIYATDIIRCL